MYSITGLTRRQIADLVEFLMSQITAEQIEPPRHDSLTIFQQVAVALTYLRRNRTQADLGTTHGVSQPVISRVVCQWTAILATVLGTWIPTGDQLPEGSSWLVDGTLVPCWSWSEHPEDWSGKHHTTGRNLIVVADLKGNLVWVSDPYPGSTHDITAIRATNILQTPRTTWVADKGFIGQEAIITPVKKLPGQEHLDPQDKEYNQQVSSIRAPIERANAQLKTWRILHTDYRRPHHTHPETITAVLGLEFYKMSHE